MKCRGLIFFGVPHLGLRNEALRTIVQGQPNETFINSVVVDHESEPSDYLSRLSGDFARCFHDYTHVMSWYEGNTSPLVEVSSKSSPVFNNSLKIEKQLMSYA